jgi:predicted PurR-regulated permease PerM
MHREVTRTTLAVLSIGALIAASFWILRPFLGALIWATMIVVATWPVLLRLQAALGGKRGFAVVAMTLVMLLVFVLPFWAAIAAVADYSDNVGTWAKTLQHLKIPPPPDFVAALPLFGAKLAAWWQDIASKTPEVLAAQFQPYLVTTFKWLATEAGTVGMLIVQLLLTVIITAVLFANGEEAAEGVRRFGRRLAGERGEDVVRLAGQAIRGVALGVVVTALAQSLLGGLGLVVAGVPFAGVLTAVMLMLCIAQVGPILVLLPAVLWLYWTGDTVWGTVLLVWTVVVGTMDNFLRPFLIKMGADLPLLLIFAGVIGGLLTLGLVGVFVGPVVLAVTYTLLESWVNDVEPSAARDDAGGRGGDGAA